MQGKLKETVIGKLLAGIYLTIILGLTILFPFTQGYSLIVVFAVTVPWNLFFSFVFEQILGDWTMVFGAIFGAFLNTFLLYGIGYILDRFVDSVYRRK